jgi:hypothetical protein
LVRISDRTTEFIKMMKEISEYWCKKYTSKLGQVKNDDTETKILALAANMEKDNEIAYSMLEEIINSVNELHDKIPTENQIISAKIESKDIGSSAALTREQLKELEAREKRASQIYG